MTRVDFQARVWLDAADVMELSIWVPELYPTQDPVRSATEWIEEAISYLVPRSEYLALIANNPLPGVTVSDDGCYQLLLKDTISGHLDGNSLEYEEEIEFSE